MTIKILYFAALRDAVGRSEESLALPAGVATVGELRAFLADRGDAWSALDSGRNVRAARNQRMAQASDPIMPGDEVAFFPPVTGG
ncbi:MAG: molybdopterin converting factor subunit 1 [Rhodocyclaceae bacterium]